jgi:mgtE-like transporter
MLSLLRQAWRSALSLPSAVAGLVRRERRSLAQGFVANLVSSFGDLAAGVVLGAATGRLEQVPGLLLLIPPAIGMRGNIFAAMGSRLGTALHLGQFEPKLRRGGVLGDNVAAVTVNTLVLSAAIAPMARLASIAFGVTSVTTLDFVVVSLLGGVISSAVVLLVTVSAAVVGARRGWDIDYVTPPLATVTGDAVTLPALLAASWLVGLRYVTPLVAVAGLALAPVVVGQELRKASGRTKRIIKESIPVLLVAAGIDLLAGVTLEKRLEAFMVYPVFLATVPAFLEDSGNLGIMLSARLASRLHVGIIRPRFLPTDALSEIFLIILLSFPVYVALGLSASLIALVFGLSSPGWLPVLGVTMLAGAITVIAAALVAYYSAVAAYRLDLDPDNHGAPLITSAMDVVAAVAMIVALAVFGYVHH